MSMAFAIFPNTSLTSLRFLRFLVIRIRTAIMPAKPTIATPATPSCPHDIPPSFFSAKARMNSAEEMARKATPTF